MMTTIKAKPRTVRPRVALAARPKRAASSGNAKRPVQAADAPFALVDHAYDRIREAIREGTLKAGDRLVERELALQLDVSRTPVREALRLLEAHGLASTHAGRGLFVTALGPEEVAELYFAWEQLEGLAARTAAQYASALEIEALQEIHAQWDEDGAPRALGRVNKRLHAAIHVATHNRFLARALRTIDDSVTLLGLTTYTIPGRGREVAAEHGAIVDAIAKRDGDAAEEAARRHIRRAGQLRMALTAERDAREASGRGAGRSARRM